MKRVMIVGGPGAGKSTLALQLGERTGLPVFHMDKIHYEPGWVERDQAHKSHMTREVHALERWIFDGGHSATYAERLARADHFVWLDFSVWRRLYRIVQRAYIHRGRNRPDMADGCLEQFNRQTIDFLFFVIRTRNTSRRKLQAIHTNPPEHLQVIRLSNQREIDAFLAGA